MTAIVALRLLEDRRKEILNFKIGWSENTEVASDLLRGLKNRGLRSQARRFSAVIQRGHEANRLQEDSGSNPKLALAHLERPDRKEDPRVRVNLHATAVEDLVPERLGRREPREVKRLPKNYQLMNKPRHEMVEIEHRNNHRKIA